MSRFFFRFSFALFLILILMPGSRGLAEEKGLIGPTLIREEPLSGREIVGKKPLLNKKMVWRLLENEEAPLLALRFVDETLQQGGAPLTSPDWLRMKVHALFQLERFEESLYLLENLPEKVFTKHPELILINATLLRMVGKCEQSRSLNAQFLINQPDHPLKFKAQRGIGLCLVKQKLLEEAGLHLRLYSQEPSRPKEDPLLWIALADLARQKKLFLEENRLMERLMNSTHPTDTLTRRARILALADWEAHRGRFSHALRWLESGLREEGVIQRFLTLHTKIVRLWIKNKFKKDKKIKKTKKTKSIKGLSFIFTEKLMKSIQSYLNPKNSLEIRQSYLKTLLEMEEKEKLGLMEPEGVLYPGVLVSQPLPTPFRLSYAVFYRHQKDWQTASEMLKDLDTLEADGERLLLLAEQEEVDDFTLDDILGRLPNPKKWCKTFQSQFIEALFLFVNREHQSSADQLYALIQPLSTEKSLRRAQIFYQALLQEKEGDLNKALSTFLELAFPDTNDLDEDNYLPQAPRLAAARILEKQGWYIEAENLAENLFDGQP